MRSATSTRTAALEFRAARALMVLSLGTSSASGCRGKPPLDRLLDASSVGGLGRGSAEAEDKLGTAVDRSATGSADRLARGGEQPDGVALHLQVKHDNLCTLRQYELARLQRHSLTGDDLDAGVVTNVESRRLRIRLRHAERFSRQAISLQAQPRAGSGDHPLDGCILDLDPGKGIPRLQSADEILAGQRDRDAGQQDEDRHADGRPVMNLHRTCSFPGGARGSRPRRTMDGCRNEPVSERTDYGLREKEQRSGRELGKP